MRTKQGDTYAVTGLYSSDAGVPIDLTSYTIASSIRTRAMSLLGSFTVVKANQTTSPGVFTMTAPDTSIWSPGDLLCDVKVVDGSGNVTHTETFVISLDARITS